MKIEDKKGKKSKEKKEMVAMFVTSLIMLADCFFLFTILALYICHLERSLQQTNQKIELMNLSDSIKINSLNMTIMNLRIRLLHQDILKELNHTRGNNEDK